MVISFNNFDLYMEMAAWSQRDQQEGSTDDSLSPTSWGNLRRTNPCYDATSLTKQRLLYLGGEEIQRRAGLFCPRFGWETSDDSYHDRLAAGAYIPIMGKHIDFYSAMLFDVPLTISEATNAENKKTIGTKLNPDQEGFYQFFAEACDISRHQTLQHFIAKQFICALLHQVAFTGIDIPKQKRDNYLSYSQQKEDGLLSPYLYHIDPMCVIDWQYSENNESELNWIKLFYELPVQKTPLAKPMKQFRIVLWELENDVAICTSHLTKPVSSIKDLDDRYEVPLEDQPIITSYPCIPIKVMNLHSGLAIGAKLAPLAAEHFQRRTHTNYSAYRDALIVPTHKRSNMIPGVGQSFDPRNVDGNSKFMPRAKVDSNGIYQIGQDEDFMIVEAEGKVLAFLQQQNEDLEQRMALVVNQMATALHKKQQSHSTSAQSKQEDRHESETMLESFAEIVRNHIQQIYQFITNHRQEDVVWNIEGLRTKDYTDRSELLQEAVSLTKIDIPSATFQSAYKYKLALALVDDLSDTDKQEMRDELKEAPMSLVDASSQPATSPSSLEKNAPTTASAPEADDLSEASIPMVNGHEVAPTTMHLRAQDSTSGIGDAVYEQLKDDYSKNLISWVKAANWSGPMEVNMDQIDASNMDNWDAVKNPSRQPQIKDFEQEMTETDANKPIILINLPDNSKFKIADGHGRFTAAKNIDKPTITAFIAEVGSMKGDWDQMHRLERQGEAGGKSAQKSQQLTSEQEN